MPRHKSPSERILTRGRRRMKELGMKKVEVWLDARELALIAAVAADERKQPARWIREKAFQLAEQMHRERTRVERREQDQP